MGQEVQQSRQSAARLVIATVMTMIVGAVISNW
jgi:hypothetical protein